MLALIQLRSLVLGAWGVESPLGYGKETRGAGLWPRGALCLRSGAKPRDHGKQLDIFDQGCDSLNAICQYSFRKIIADVQCNSIDDGELFKVNSSWGVLL